MRVVNFADGSNAALGRNEPYQFARAHAFAFYRQRVLYSFIPKNACSTLRFSLAVANGALTPASDVNWIHANNPTFVADPEFVATCAYAFVVLRCPFRRLASCYLDKIVDGERHLLNLFPAPVYYLHRAFGRQALARKVQSLSFADFVRRIAAQEPRDMDSHWRPQSDFLLLRHYDDYFALEEFGRVQAALAAQGIDIIDTRGRLGHDTSGLDKISGRFTAVPGHQIRALKDQGQVPAPDSLYDDETIALVRRLYADDITLYQERFGPGNLLF